MFDKLTTDFEENENQEVRNLIEEIKETAFSLRTKEELDLFIKNHQKELHRQKKHEILSTKCDQILYFLETLFSSYLDSSLPISDVGKSEIIEDCKIYMNEQTQFLLELANPKLKEIIKPLVEFEDLETISLHEVNYILDFWRNWAVDSCLNRYSSNHEKDLLDYLIIYDFNHPPLFHYFINTIVGELDNEDNPLLLERILHNHLNKLARIPNRIGKPYRNDIPSLKSLLLEWLEKEVKQCRKRTKTFNPEQQTILSKESLKIDTSLSVAQTAYLFNLLNKTGIVTNSVKMEMLHAITQSFRTKKTETIAVESLHNKYYNVEERTKESVKTLLVQLLNNIK